MEIAKHAVASFSKRIAFTPLTGCVADTSYLPPSATGICDAVTDYLLTG